MYITYYISIRLMIIIFINILQQLCFMNSLRFIYVVRIIIYISYEYYFIILIYMANYSVNIYYYQVIVSLRKHILFSVLLPSKTTFA